MRDPFIRFFSKVTIGAGMNPCWQWTGSRTKQNKDGHGQTWDGTRKVVAHRFAWELLVGPIPDGKRLLHRCDNPICVNPRHLFPGTLSDNVRDSIAKGRWFIARGEQNGFHKLTARAVRFIRTHPLLSAKSLARRFNVSRNTINNVWSRRRWAHIE